MNNLNISFVEIKSELENKINIVLSDKCKYFDLHLDQLNSLKAVNLSNQIKLIPIIVSSILQGYTDKLNFIITIDIDSINYNFKDLDKDVIDNTVVENMSQLIARILSIGSPNLYIFKKEDLRFGNYVSPLNEWYFSRVTDNNLFKLGDFQNISVYNNLYKQQDSNDIYHELRILIS